MFSGSVTMTNKKPVSRNIWDSWNGFLGGGD
jgi:hypothetical protein